MPNPDQPQSRDPRLFPPYLREAGYVRDGLEYVRRGGMSTTPAEYLIRAGYRHEDIPNAGAVWQPEPDSSDA